MFKRERIFVAVSVAIVFVLFLSLLGGKVLQGRLKEPVKGEDNGTVKVDWEKLYPYDTQIETEAVKAEPESVAEKGKSVLLKLGNIGNKLSTSIYKYREIVALGCAVNSKLCAPNIISNRIRLKNGYWANAAPAKVSTEEAKETIQNYVSLEKYLNSEGIDFLYVCTPKKDCMKDNELPEEAVSYTNENIDTYIRAMKEAGLSYLDLRAKLHQQGLDHYSMFYRTDHHWNIDAGLWAASEIENELSSRFDIPMPDSSQFGTFSRVTYPNAMFGSAGQAVSRFLAKPEDFDILYPDFDTRFTVEIPDKNINITGSFKEVMINHEGLNREIESGGGYAYETILYGNRPYEKITNEKNPDGPKLLMIRDSFSIAAAPYLALSCSEIVLLDTRSGNGNFTGSIVNCIKRFNPDAVVALQSEPQTLTLNK